VIDDQTCLLEILDTAGQEEFTALRDQWIRECEGFVIVYSITSSHSFHQVKAFKQQVNRVKDADDLPIMLVGNKCDLEEEREVLKSQGVALAEKFGFQFKEASAKTRVNVEEAYYDLVRTIRGIKAGEIQPGKPTTKPGEKDKAPAKAAKPEAKGGFRCSLL
jgi:GTPase KRas